LWLPDPEQGKCFPEETKSIFIATPSSSCCFVLTRNELKALYEILDKADNEIKALALLELFEDSSNN